MAPVKGTAAYTLPESAEIKQPEQKAAGGLLPLLDRKPSGILHHSVIHALSCGRQKKDSGKGHKYNEQLLPSFLPV